MQVRQANNSINIISRQVDMTFKIFEITVPLGSTEENTLVKSLLKSRKKGDERKKKMQITKTEHGISIKRFQRDPINGPATASSVEHPFFCRAPICPSSIRS